MTIAKERFVISQERTPTHKIYNFNSVNGNLEELPALALEQPDITVNEIESAVVSRKIVSFKNNRTREALQVLRNRKIISMETIDVLLKFEENLPKNTKLKFKSYNLLENHEKIAVDYLEQIGSTILFDEVNNIKFPDLLTIIAGKPYICEVKTCNGKASDEPTLASNFDYKLSKKIGQCELKFSACGIDNHSKLWKQTLRFIDIYTNPNNSPSIENMLEFLKTNYNAQNKNIIIRVLDKNMIHELQTIYSNQPFDQTQAILYQVNCFL